MMMDKVRLKLLDEQTKLVQCSSFKLLCHEKGDVACTATRIALDFGLELLRETMLNRES